MNQSNINVFYYNKYKNEIYLASNRAAAGRMYFFFEGDDFFFSNDFALLVGQKQLKLNEIAFYAYLKYGAVPEDITFDSQIKSVPVSYYANINYKKRKVKYLSYFKFNHIESQKSNKELLELTEKILKSTAKEFTNQPIHMLISGGIDSTLYAFYLKEYSTNIIGHYCRFGEIDPEQKYAESAALALNIPLEIHTLYDDAIIAEIENTAFNTSYPHADFSNVSVNFLFREIKEKYGENSIIIECNGAYDGFGYDGLLKIPTWEKVLNLQSIIPLTTKLHTGEVKWPLKKILENYMPDDFIYRKKSGFAPPIERWLANGETFNYFYKNISNGISINFIKKEKIIIIFNKLVVGKN